MFTCCMLLPLDWQAWDLGGHEAVRYLWFDFLSDSHAIVFMIDGADEDRLEEAHWELSELLSDVSRHLSDH